MPSELNPNHPVIREVADQWYKLCAILMHKFGHSEIEITTEDIKRFLDSGRANIAVHPHGNTISLMLVSEQEGLRLAKEHGGLPV